ncbi:MAG: T9SS type A sorting domain-containing protein [Bacteroidia bacterium]
MNAILKYLRRLYLPGLLTGMLILSRTVSPAQCPDRGYDTIFSVSWDGGIPQDWQTPLTSDGDNWKVGSGGFGFSQPGEGRWIYVDDESSNKVGRAEILTPEVDIAGFQGDLILSFFINFQEYGGKGKASVELGSDGEWVEIWADSTDFSGKITLDISAPELITGQFRFVYDDGGEWGWGMGLDDIILTGNASQCGDGICSIGESPQSCPGDCELLGDPAPLWIPPGEDLAGVAVKYRTFQGGTICDDCSEEIDLGFDFSFFGKKYHKVWLNLNGNLTFGEDYLTFTPEPFCLGGPLMIAPFFGDVDLATGGELKYYADPEGHYFIATWTEVGYFGCKERPCALSNTFQVIMTDSTIRQIRNVVLPVGTTIVFTYGDMQWTTGNSSGGAGGFGGSAATVGSNLGDGNTCYDYGTFGKEGFTYGGNSQTDGCPPNGVDHLDFRSVFLDGNKGELLFPSGKVVLEGEAMPDGNQLYWTIDLSEIVDYFIVERSVDRVRFEELNMVSAESNILSGTFYYEYLDEDISSGDPLWYRLVQIRSDGSIVYSDTVQIIRGKSDKKVEESSFTLLKAGPNPFETELWVQYAAKSAFTTTYKLVDMAGRQHLAGNMNVISGTGELRIQVPELPSGMYVLTFFFPNGQQHVNLVHR